MTATQPPDSGIRAGLRAALPFVLPTLPRGVSFGVLAQPVMGSIAPVVMSVVVFSGAAQFAALTVLAAGGGDGRRDRRRDADERPLAADGLRGRSVASRRRPLRARRVQAIVDASFAISSRGDGTFDRGLLVGATLPQGGVVDARDGARRAVGSALGDPGAPRPRRGLPGLLPVALAGEEARSRRAGAAGAGGRITVALMPVAPLGVPGPRGVGGRPLGLRRRGE